MFRIAYWGVDVETGENCNFMATFLADIGDVILQGDRRIRITDLSVEDLGNISCSEIKEDGFYD